VADTSTTAQESAVADTTHVDATLTESAIQLSNASVPAGPVHFQIRNSGQAIHVFEVEGEGIEEEIETIPAGADTVLVVNLKPGTYEVYCPREDDAVNHKEKGMTTRLTVR
jgi:iron uptake system EfeUOB component EfeO/EfeM